MEDKQSRVARRTFLAGAGVVAAAGAAVVATRGQPALAEAVAAKAEPADPAPGSDGYRVSAHIRKYYRTTLV
ncbi:formate dehydrogenase [Cupriavidus metallidurans]|uniref:formate dehydrogenase n=1 Tax=Cupriavidus metallidurans TaxID=119219 RepID=UPI001CCB8F28|nr:formate dehydrogenase [Cupriavidus metallidurans]UBM10321.1 formate dehydrogenase [Cupriavidus metallidurans]